MSNVASNGSIKCLGGLADDRVDFASDIALKATNNFCDEWMRGVLVCQGVEERAAPSGNRICQVQDDIKAGALSSGVEASRADGHRMDCAQPADTVTNARASSLNHLNGNATSHTNQSLTAFRADVTIAPQAAASA